MQIRFLIGKRIQPEVAHNHQAFSLKSCRWKKGIKFYPAIGKEPWKNMYIYSMFWTKYKLSWSSYNEDEQMKEVEVNLDKRLDKK